MFNDVASPEKAGKLGGKCLVAERSILCGVSIWHRCLYIPILPVRKCGATLLEQVVGWM